MICEKFWTHAKNPIVSLGQRVVSIFEFKMCLVFRRVTWQWQIHPHLLHDDDGISCAAKNQFPYFLDNQRGFGPVYSRNYSNSSQNTLVGNVIPNRSINVNPIQGCFNGTTRHVVFRVYCKNIWFVAFQLVSSVIFLSTEIKYSFRHVRYQCRFVSNCKQWTMRR